MRKLMWFTIGFAVSCVTGVYLLSGSILGWLALAFALLFVVTIFIRLKPAKVICVVLLGFSVGISWMWGYDTLYLQPAQDYDGKAAMVDIEASDYSCATEYGATVDGYAGLGDRNYRVRVYLDEFCDIKPGDVLRGVYTFSMTTPSGEEESDYYQGKGIFLLADPEGGIVIEPVDKVPTKYFASAFRKYITDTLEKVFPSDVLGFVRALLLGDSSLLTYEENTAFKVSGIRHIIAVSGLHISILFSFVYTVSLRRGISTALIGIPVLLVFAAIVGFTPSITRACIMQILLIIALLLNREYDPPTALAFAVLVILAINPMAVTSVSFQLSVGCVIGIFLFSGRISTYILNKLGRPKGKSIKARLARGVASGTGVTLSAMVFTTPLVAWYFGMVSLIGVLTNLLTLWAVSIVFYGIMFVCIFAWLWLPLGKVIAWIIAWLARYVLLVAKLLSAIPLASVYTESIYVVLWIAVCYLLFVVFLLFKKKSPITLLASVAVCLAVYLAASYVEPRLDDIRMTVYDVGEGQAILLQTYGEYYLVDCGGTSSSTAADVVASSLLSQGVFELDGIIVTHYDMDHAGGIDNLLSRVKTKRLYIPDIDDDGELKESLIKEYSEKVYLVDKSIVKRPGNSELRILLPETTSSDDNESGICVLFQAKNYDILITGDRGITGERALLASRELPQLDVLVAGHHGSAESTNFELLSKTMPKSVVVSSGDRYGHPANELLSRLKMFGCQVLRTDKRGTIIFRG